MTPKGAKRLAVVIDRHAAELTYAVLIATHPYCPSHKRARCPAPERSRSLAVARLVQDARTEGWKIVPLFPFLNRERTEYRNRADVFDI